MLGTVTGAVLMATAFWVLSGFVPPLSNSVRAAGVVIGAAVVWATKDAALFKRFRLPENQRQIPPEVLFRSGLSGPFQFGFEIGTGVRTYLPTGAPHVVAILLLLSAPTIVEAVVCGASFGVGRGVQQVATAVARNRDCFQEGWQRPVSAIGPFVSAITALGGVAVLL